MPKGNQRRKLKIKKSKGLNNLFKIEDPIPRIIRQQEMLESEVSQAVQTPKAEQRDSKDPTFNFQGSTGYLGTILGYGTKDQMPGTTPYVGKSVLDTILEKLRIKKGDNKKPIKPKGTGNLI